MGDFVDRFDLDRGVSVSAALARNRVSVPRKELVLREDAIGGDGRTVREAGVDQCHGYTLAGEAQVVLDAIGAHGLDCGVHRGDDLSVGGDRDDSWIGGHRLDLFSGEESGDSVD